MLRTKQMTRCVLQHAENQANDQMHSHLDPLDECAFAPTNVQKTRLVSRKYKFTLHLAQVPPVPCNPQPPYCTAPAPPLALPASPPPAAGVRACSPTDPPVDPVRPVEGLPMRTCQGSPPPALRPQNDSILAQPQGMACCSSGSGSSSRGCLGAPAPAAAPPPSASAAHCMIGTMEAARAPLLPCSPPPDVPAAAPHAAAAACSAESAPSLQGCLLQEAASGRGMQAGISKGASTASPLLHPGVGGRADRGEEDVGVRPAELAGLSGGAADTPGAVIRVSQLPCEQGRSAAQAASLARLISKYEQPVLRFSLWNKDGSLCT